jgi:hypothetical protein
MAEEIEIRTTAAFRLIGSKQEILIVLEGLAHKGFKWKTNGKYYPQRDNPTRFAYYLNYLYVPSVGYVTLGGNNEFEPRFGDMVLEGNDSKPRLGDMVLGGNNPATPTYSVPPHITVPHTI